MNKLKLKDLRIYHKKHLSYKEIKEQDFFFLIDNLLLKDEKDILLECLILLVRSINIKDSLSDFEIDRRVNLHIKLVETSRKRELDISIKKEFLDRFKKTYKTKNYIDKFRGDLVEYITVYLYKSSSSRILHEPLFKLKRRRLIPKSIIGFDCLVDVVKVSNKYRHIDLYECKANLDNHITYVNTKKSPFKRKLKYMNALETQLTKFYCEDNLNTIKVTKNLVSLITPQKTISSKYNNFHQIDLLRRFKLGQAVV